MATDALDREYRTHQNKLEFECHLWALLSYSCPVPILYFTLLLEIHRNINLKPYTSVMPKSVWLFLRLCD